MKENAVIGISSLSYSFILGLNLGTIGLLLTKVALFYFKESKFLFLCNFSSSTDYLRAAYLSS
jgi:hypothetical protein